MKKNNKKTRNDKAITLIALVVTIIILLILAGVTVGIAVNGTGLFEKAKLATDEYNNLVDKENYELGQAMNNIENYSSFARAGELGIHYSTEEQKIGTWLNNEDLYAKTFVITNFSNPTNIGISCEKIVNMSGYHIFSSISSSTFPYVPSTNDMTTYYNFHKSGYINGSNQFIPQFGSNVAGGTLYLTIQYLH